VVLGEEVGDWVESGGQSEGDADDDLGVGDLVFGNEAQVLGDVMSHLRSRRGSSVVVLNHAIMQLRGHGNNHVVEVRVEVSAFRDVETEWRVVVVTGEQVV